MLSESSKTLSYFYPAFTVPREYSPRTPRYRGAQEASV